MATVKSKPTNLSALRKAAELVKKEVSKVDVNRDGKITRAEVTSYAKSLRNKQLGEALLVAHGLGSHTSNGATALSLAQMKRGVDKALGHVIGRDTNRNGRIDAGGELTSAEKLKSFQALAGLATKLNLGVTDAGPIASLKRAFATANDIGVFSSYGHSFELLEFPANASDRTIMAAAMGVDRDDVTTDDLDPVGAAAAGGRRFLSSLESSRDNPHVEYDDDAEQADMRRAYEAGIRGIRTYLQDVKLKDASFYVHDIAEDGDVESQVLIGTRPDGTRVAMVYSHNPF